MNARLKGLDNKYQTRSSLIYNGFCTLYQVQQHLSGGDSQKLLQTNGMFIVDRRERQNECGLWQDKLPQVK